MKKISLVIAAMVLFAGVSFAQTAPAAKTAPAKTEKKEGKKKGEKKGAKMDKKSDKAAK